MSIVFLVPSKAMAETAGRVAEEFKSDRIIISQGLLSKAIPLAKALEEQDAEVFITRGGTALVLKQAGIRTPVVEIPITGKDMTDALARARDLTGKEHPRIAVVAFGNMMKHLVDFLPLISLDLRCHELEREEDAARAVDRTIRDGADVVLGGVVTVRTAKERGLPAVLLESGESSFRHALHDARRIAYARKLESRRGMEFRAILEYAYEGIVAVNGGGTISLFNPIAEELTGVRAKDALGNPQGKLFPPFNWTKFSPTGKATPAGLSGSESSKS